jgi:hypothetical protein
MSSHKEAIDGRDLESLRAVRDLWSRADPAPAGLAERMKFAITVHALHAEVAELMESSLVPTRGDDVSTAVEPTLTESVTFTAASVSLMVTASAHESDASLVKVDGWVTRGGAEVDAVAAGVVSTVVADEHGRFVIDALPKGPVHFLIRSNPGNPAARPVITPTIEL